MLEIETPHGDARVHVNPAEEAKGAVVLGHGAGGGVEAPDLVAATEAGNSEGFTVALVEQPYRVAGRRSPAPAQQLDTAWSTVLDRLLAGELAALPLIVGGRSLGARVACRWAAARDVAGVLCLAFPLQPPRRAGKPASPSRLAELDGVTVPTLVVQGERDQFGTPPEGEHRTVVRVPGNHSLRSDVGAVGEAVRAWLQDVSAPRP